MLLINSVYKSAYKRFYNQEFLEECKYQINEKKKGIYNKKLNWFCF